MTTSADIARTRQGLYRFLGGALLPPTDDQFRLLSDAVVILTARDLDRFAFSPSWHRLSSHFPIDVRGSQLDVDYVRLFASGRSGALAPPTESYYRVPAKGGGIAEFVAGIQREYRNMGIVSVGFGEAPDHVSTELELMAHLCDLEANNWASGQTRMVDDTLNLQHRFLVQHLRVWIPQFRRRVREAPPSPFYVDLVDALHAFVVHDADYVHLFRRELVG